MPSPDAGRSLGEARGWSRAKPRRSLVRCIGGTILTAACVLHATAQAALADCTPDSATAQTGNDVTCAGTTTTGFAAGTGVERLQITVEQDAIMQNAAGLPVIRINSNNQGRTPGPPTNYGVRNLGLIEVAGDGGVGILGAGPLVVGDFNAVRNEGTIDAALDGLFGVDMIAIDLGDFALVENVGDILLRGDGSIGIRVGSDASVTQAGLIEKDHDTTGDDVIGIEGGDRTVVSHAGATNLHGDRNVGIRIGDDGLVDLSGEVWVGAETRLQPPVLPVDRLDPIGVQMGDGTAGLSTVDAPRGLIVSGLLAAEGQRARGAIVGSGWFGANGEIRVDGTGALLVRGADAVGLLVGADGAVTVGGGIFAFGERAVGVYMGNQTRPDPALKLVLSGTVSIARADAIGVSLGAKTGDAGDPDMTLATSFSPAIEIGLEGFAPSAPGDIGSGIIGDASSGPLVEFRDDQSDLNHLLVRPYAAVTADESMFFQPNRAIAIQGTDGGERIDSYGEIGGKVLLEGGDDFFHLGPGGSFTGDMSVSGGDGFDTLELADRWGFAAAGSVTDVDLEDYYLFEHVRIADTAFRVSGHFDVTSPGATLRVEDAGTLVIDDSVVVDGDVTFGADSTLSLDLSTLASEARLQSTGVLDFEDTGTGGPTLELTTSEVLDTGSYVLATASGLGNGEFARLERPSGTLSASVVLDYDTAGGVLTLEIVRGVFARDNREITDGYVYEVMTSAPGAELQAALDSLIQMPLDDYVDAIDQLHPEAYDAQTSVQLALARQFDESLLERPGHCIAPARSGRRHPRTGAPCRPRPFDVWAAGYGLFRKRTGSDAHISWSDDGGGLVMGFDHRRGNDLLFSMAVGGARAISDVDGIGSGRFTALDAGALAAYSRGPLLVQGFASYGHGWHQAYRNIDYADVSRASEGEYESNRVSIGGELAWTFALEGLDVSPSFEADWARVMRPAFTEHGAAPLDLSVQSTNDSVTTIRIGVEAGTSILRKGYWTELFENADGVWEPSISVKWRQVVAGADRAYTSSIAGAPAGTGPATVYGDDASQGFEIGAGFWFTPKFATRITFGAGYEAFVWKDVVSHDVKGRIGYSF